MSKGKLSNRDKFWIYFVLLTLAVTIIFYSILLRAFPNDIFAYSIIVYPFLIGLIQSMLFIRYKYVNFSYKSELIILLYIFIFSFINIFLQIKNPQSSLSSIILVFTVFELFSIMVYIAFYFGSLRFLSYWYLVKVFPSKIEVKDNILSYELDQNDESVRQILVFFLSRLFNFKAHGEKVDNSEIYSRIFERIDRDNWIFIYIHKKTKAFYLLPLKIRNFFFLQIDDDLKKWIDNFIKVLIKLNGIKSPDIIFDNMYDSLLTQSKPKAKEKLENMGEIIQPTILISFFVVAMILIIYYWNSIVGLLLTQDRTILTAAIGAIIGGLFVIIISGSGKRIYKMISRK